jgi:hypothetical protein
MSWDVSVFAAKVPPPPVAEMPDDWRGEIIGTRDDVRAKISACIPGVNWSDPTWGVVDGEGFSFEFNVGRKEPNDGFIIHVRGGENAVPVLTRLGEQCGWYLLDCSQGEWLHYCSDTDSGWEGFQAYRDRVLGRTSSQGGEPA